MKRKNRIMLLQLNNSINIPNMEINGTFSASCVISLHDTVYKGLERNALFIKLTSSNTDIKIKCFKLSIGPNVEGYFEINVSGNDTNINIGAECQGRFRINTWRASEIILGEKTTSNDTRIICDNSYFECGQDCMFSDGVIIQTSDQHGIVDISTKQIVNNEYSRTILGKHVWLGRESTLMPNITIGDGCIIGARALVTSPFHSNTIVGGVPARIVKTGMTWSRSPVTIDQMTENYLVTLID